MASLDAFRGLTIMSMILVNNPGDWSQIYAPLRHAEWHGCTPTDLIFPFFLFIVGAAIPIGLKKYVTNEGLRQSRSQLIGKIIRRTLILFGLGLFLNGFGLLFRLGDGFGWGDLWPSLRIPGVLQRIAICYLVVSFMYLWIDVRQLYFVTLVGLLGYWALMVWVPVPETGEFANSPKKMAAIAVRPIDTKDGNLAAYVDRQVFGTHHLWSSAKTWDPEGLLSTLPAVATTLLGLFAGRWLLAEGSTRRKVLGLLVAGACGVAVGWCWGTVFPINKQLWTSSYAVYTAGWAALVLGLCVWLFDGLGFAQFAVPLHIYGVNAITVFVLSGVVGRTLVSIHFGQQTLKSWVYANCFLSWSEGKFASLMYALTWVASWFVVLYLMYRRNLILKVG